MSLEWNNKVSFVRSATAIPAIFATETLPHPTTIAKIATVAVANVPIQPVEDHARTFHVEQIDTLLLQSEHATIDTVIIWQQRQRNHLHSLTSIVQWMLLILMKLQNFPCGVRRWSSPSKATTTSCASGQVSFTPTSAMVPWLFMQFFFAM